MASLTPKEKAAQLRARRTEAEAAAPTKIAMGPPIVPDVPNLRAVLNLPPNVFTVRHQDLMRKAMDELTLGLSWYIMYTMVHSAAWAEYSKDKASPRPIVFQAKPRHSPSQQQRLLGAKVESPKDILDSIHEFASASFTRETRDLLAHIVNLNYKRPRKIYYGDGIVEAASSVRQCSLFLYHRNGFVPESSAVGDESMSEYQAIHARERSVAVFFFRQIKKLLKDLPKASEIKGAPVWIKQACDQLRKAADSHLSVVQDIRKIFDFCDSVPTAISSVAATASATQDGTAAAAEDPLTRWHPS
jgi:hypothetical protein